MIRACTCCVLLKTIEDAVSFAAIISLSEFCTIPAGSFCVVIWKKMIDFERFEKYNECSWKEMNGHDRK